RNVVSKFVELRDRATRELVRVLRIHDDRVHDLPVDVHAHTLTPKGYLFGCWNDGPDVRERQAAIRALHDAEAIGRIGLIACRYIDGVGVDRIDRDRIDRQVLPRVAQRHEVDAAVDALPDASAGRADV